MRVSSVNSGELRGDNQRDLTIDALLEVSLDAQGEDSPTHQSRRPQGTRSETRRIVVKIYVDTTGKQLTASKDPEPKTDQNGRQRNEKDSGRPMWSTQVFVMDETGGEVISVTTAGEKPLVRQGQLVQLVQLEAVPWAMETNGKARSGVSFRAVDIKQVEVRSAK